jgi:hypothetical protein
MVIGIRGGGVWRWLGTYLALALVLTGGMRGVALATCGDGVRDWDEDEECDAGAANGTDNCCSATCRVVDDDQDGLCDAHDPCDGAFLLPVRSARLQISRLGNGTAGDERYRVSARMTVAAMPPIDPTTRGLRLVVGEYALSEREVFLDAVVPGGPGWRRTTDGAAWLYRNRASGEGGVTRADVRLVTASPPTYDVLVQGQSAVTDLIQPFIDWPFLIVTLAMDAGTGAGQCGDSALPESRCRLRHGGRLTCEPPPPIRSCVGALDPLACDTRNCASAEERYFDDNGLSYYSGDCLGLPGFVPSSPEASFAGSGSTTDYTVTGSFATTGRSCTWTSNPAFGHPHLICAD